MLGDIGPSEMILIYLAFAMGLANVFLLLDSLIHIGKHIK